MTPQHYCRAKTKRSRSSFYYPMLFLEKSRRTAMYTLYAFCREVDDIVDDNRPPESAREALAGWRKELEAVFSGKPRHPVGLELARIKSVFNLPPRPFFEIIEGMEMDLNQQRYATLEKLLVYCQKVAVAVGWASLQIFSHQHPNDVWDPTRKAAFAHHLGIAFQLTNILRDVAEDARRGRIYLPAETLQQAGASEADILNLRWSRALALAMADIGREAENHFQKAHALAQDPKQRPILFPALVMSGIYHAYLKQMQKRDFNTLHHPIKLSTPAKLWIAWRTWHAEGTGSIWFRNQYIKKR